MKTRKIAVNETGRVNEYMDKLDHPLKSEMEMVRAIIKNAHSQIGERIKWIAPSFFYKNDLVTFNHRAQPYVHLVFHHPSIVNIKSDLLNGDYTDRRMAYFHSMEEVEANKSELKNIMKELVNFVDN